MLSGSEQEREDRKRSKILFRLFYIGKLRSMILFFRIRISNAMAVMEASMDKNPTFAFSTELLPLST
jgi:hypothetical protein